MKKTYVVPVISLLLVIALFSVTYFPIYGQVIEPVECGDIVPGEFTYNRETHTYLLNMKAEESVVAFIKRSGATLKTRIDILGPSDVSVIMSSAILEDAPTIATGPLASNGTYKIEVGNWRLGGQPGGIGNYQLLISCETLDGPIPIGGPDSESTPIVPKESLTVPSLPTFVEVGASYNVHLFSGVHSVKIVGMREDGWVEVIIENDLAWLNLSQVALIVPQNE